MPSGDPAGTHSVGAGFSGVTEHKVKFRYDTARRLWIAHEFRGGKYVAARTIDLPPDVPEAEVAATYRVLRRGRSKRDDAAAGLRQLAVQLPAELVERVDAAASRAGVSRAEYVAGWAKRLPKCDNSDNRHGTPK